MFSEKRILRHNDLTKDYFTLNTATGTRLKERHNNGSDVSDDQFLHFLEQGAQGPIGELISQDSTSGANIIVTPTFRKPEEFYEPAIKTVNQVQENLGKKRDEWWLAIDFGTEKDCYSPEKAPDEYEARKFHEDNLQRTRKHANSENTVLWFETINSISEAIGIAVASNLQKEVPLAICFVLDDDGKLLDRNELWEAVNEIKKAVKKRTAPIFIGINCCGSEAAKTANNSLQKNVGREIDISYINASDRCGKYSDGINGVVSLDPQNLSRKEQEIGSRISGVCCGGTHEHVHKISEVQQTRSLGPSD